MPSLPKSKPTGTKKVSKPPPVVLEDDIAIPAVTTQPAEDLDRSISLYPATVTSLHHELRPVTPGVEETLAKIKVNYEGFGFRLEERLRRRLESLSTEIEAKERLNSDISLEIASRKRVLSSLQAQNCTWDDHFLRTQIKARDQQIVILSDRLFDLTARRKGKSQEDGKKTLGLVASLHGQIEGLLGVIRNKDEEIERLRTGNREEMERKRGKVEEFLEEIARLKEEVETFRGRWEAKEREVREIKLDLQTQNQVAGHEGRNSAELMQEIQVLQTSKTELMTIRAELEMQILNLNQENQKLQENIGKCTEISRKIAENLTSHISSLSSFPDQSLPELSLLKDHLQSDIHSLASLLSSPSPTPRHKEKQQLEIALETAKNEIKRLEMEGKEAKMRLEAVKVANGMVTEQMEKSLAEKVDLILGLDSELKSLRQEVFNFEPERTKLTSQLVQKQGELNTLLGRIEELVEGNNTLLAKLESAEKQTKSSSEYIQDLHSALQKMEKLHLLQEQTYVQHRLKLRTMEVELWNKDTEMLERERKMAELKEEMEKVRVDGDTFNARLRKEVAEQLVTITQQLESKDQEISLLKDMLRSLQSQIKQKDTDMTRIKRKFGDTLSPKKMTSDMSSPKVGQGEEAREMVESFCWQVERLRKFAVSKKAKIEAMEGLGGVTPTWLKEELKLTKAPDDSLRALEVLQMSLEQRLSLLLEKIKSMEETGNWGFVGEMAVQDAIMSLPEMQGEQWEGLVDSLRKYSARILQVVSTP